VAEPRRGESMTEVTRGGGRGRKGDLLRASKYAGRESGAGGWRCSDSRPNQRGRKGEARDPARAHGVAGAAIEQPVCNPATHCRVGWEARGPAARRAHWRRREQVAPGNTEAARRQWARRQARCAQDTQCSEWVRSRERRGHAFPNYGRGPEVGEEQYPHAEKARAVDNWPGSAMAGGDGGVDEGGKAKGHTGYGGARHHSSPPRSSSRGGTTAHLPVHPKRLHRHCGGRRRRRAGLRCAGPLAGMGTGGMAMAGKGSRSIAMCMWILPHRGSEQAHSGHEAPEGSEAGHRSRTR